MHRALRAAIALFGMIGTASAASPPAPVSASTDVDWSGFYAGLTTGFSSGKFKYDDGSESIDVRGLFVGGQAGYNFVLVNNVVLGLQVDADWSDQHGTLTNTDFGYTDNIRTDWTGSATAHLGVTTGPLMLYGLAGVVVAHAREDYAGYIPITSIGSTAGTQVGWTAGLGGEARVSDQLGVFLEGRYVSYKSASLAGTWHTSGGSGGTWTLPATEADWTIRGGLNWHF